MPDFVISEFGGLNTKKEDPANGIFLPTKVAKNVDLRGGIIKPYKLDKFVEQGHGGEIHVYGEQIVSGKENYVEFMLNGYKILVYKESGEWRRAVRDQKSKETGSLSVVNLGQPKPEPPSIKALSSDTTKVKAEISPDGWFYEMGYVITFVRDINGYRDESAPSDIITAQNENLAFEVRRPTVSGDGVIGWNIYRISTGYRATSSFQKVAEVSIGSDSYDDYLIGSELNGTFEGIFTSDGATVLRQPPPVQFDGVCPKLHYGQMLGWKDEVIYISEANSPESYPAQYQLRCNSKILSIEVYGGDIYAFTESGIQRIIGDNPISMAILPDEVGHRVIGRRATISTEHGLFYAYKDGLGRINSNGAASISRTLLSNEYFSSLNMASAHVNFADGVLYLFHDKGSLLYIEERGIGFVELTEIYDGSYYDRKNERILVTKGNRAWSIHGGDENTTVQYQQDGLVLNQPEDKSFIQIRIFGTGQFECILFMDGIEENRRVLSLEGLERDRIISFPYGNQAREASWRLTGTGRITEIKAILNDG